MKYTKNYEAGPRQTSEAVVETNGVITKINQSRVLFLLFAELKMYNFPFIEAIYEENNDNFQIGDLVTFYNVNSTDVYNNSIYGLVICNKTVDIISLCGALPEPEIIHKLSGSWLIVISEYSFSNITYPESNKICLDDSKGISFKDLLIFSNYNETANVTYEVLEKSSDGCITLSTNIIASKYGDWIFVAKVGTSSNRYSLQSHDRCPLL